MLFQEWVNIHDKQYGLERLCAVVSKNWKNSVENIQQAVIDDVMQHIGQQKVYDDVATEYIPVQHAAAQCTGLQCSQRMSPLICKQCGSCVCLEV